MKPFTILTLSSILSLFAHAIERVPVYAANSNHGAKQVAANTAPAVPTDSKIFPPAADSAYYLAGQYVVSGRYEEAISYFDQAIKFAASGSGHFRIADAFYSKGNAHVYLNQPQKAIEDYTKATHLDSKYTLAYYMRGQTYESLGDHPKAIEDFKKAIELDQKFALAFGGLAMAYHKSGEQQRAVEYASNSIALDPANAWFYDTRAQAYWILQEYDKYVEDISKEIALLSTAPDGSQQPRNLLAPAYYNRAQAYQKLGKADLAQKDFERAKELGYKQEPKQSSAAS
jgi:tetratricopeptide (TPR) repeat protein